MATSKLLENAVLFSVTLRRPSSRRKVSVDKVEAETDKTMLHVSKDILDSEELLKISRLDGDYKRWLSRRVLPVLRRRSVYAVPVSMLLEVDERTAQLRRETSALVEEFVPRLPLLKREARRRLRGLYDPEDYPSAGAFRAAFAVESEYLTIGTPDALKKISVTLWDKERKKAEAYWRRAEDEVRDALREAFAELVGHAVDRLQNREGGKPKVFRDSLVEKLNDFLGLFEKRNVIGDGELADLVAKAKALTRGVSPDALRDNARLRDRVRKGFEEVKGVLDTMLVDRPARRMRLGEDEE